MAPHAFFAKLMKFLMHSLRKNNQEITEEEEEEEEEKILEGVVRGQRWTDQMQDDEGFIDIQDADFIISPTLFSLEDMVRFADSFFIQ